MKKEERGRAGNFLLSYCENRYPVAALWGEVESSIYARVRT